MTLRKTLLKIGSIILAGHLSIGTATAKDNFTKAGDIFQIILPGAAMICSGMNHNFKSTGLRFVEQGLVIKASKQLLGHTSINQRPNGNWNGFPSGHTAAAFYGASYLSRKCTKTTGGKILVWSLATMVGASRVHGDNHTVGQVIAGALVGVAFDRVKVSFTDKRVKVGWRYEF